ncbi:hypothetical protein [Plantactinospora sp. CA-290183]|uniref:hypothetical protein n=1 Tax=Plantactinospora sp. CA-290183 TaxID=3240006 RepID=UPI003D903F3B
MTLALSTLLTGCGAERRDPSPSAAPPSPDATPTASAPAAVPAAATCPPAGADHPAGAELRGVTDNPQDSLWALLFLRGPEGVRADTEVKIVWRMTGSGDFAIAATGPGGATAEPVWGPTAHGGSNWSRPGDEWGTGWTFPAPGCWTVRATRAGGTAGTLALRVG